MERRNHFSAQTEREQLAWAAFNLALGELAICHGVNADDLNEEAGGCVEAVIEDFKVRGTAA